MSARFRVWSVVMKISGGRGAVEYRHDWNVDGLDVTDRQVMTTFFEEDVEDMLQGGSEPFSSMRVTR